MRDKNTNSSRNLHNLDAVKRIISIGIDEANRSLSEILKRRVLLRISDLLPLKTNEVREFLSKEIPDIGVLIMQGFHGELNGISSMVYSHEYADSLIRLLIDKKKSVISYQIADRASLEEFGNILFVSCISMIADVCNLKVWFDLPKVYLNGMKHIVDSLSLAFGEFKKYLVLRNVVSIGEFEIKDYLLLLLAFENFDQIINCMIANSDIYLKNRKDTHG